ncbi:MAG: methyltransferase domain-containing protein [Kiloniellales bacterium]|nr:methyltransferase domain-containing protein [Kiloniellales bacterium]
MTAEPRTSIARLHERRQSPAWLFFRRFLAHPLRLASVLESSPALSRLVAEQLPSGPGDFVIELGAGTGPVTRALLAAGVAPERLIAVEIDPEMAAFLRRRVPGVTVLACDALALERALPAEARGRVGAVICGLPISLLPAAQRAELVGKMLSLLPPGRPFLAYTHRLTSPLQAAELGLAGERRAFTLLNLPPASVWAYRPLP